MRIEFVGDVLTQPLAPLGKRVTDVHADIVHHGIDQHFQVLMSDITADFLVCHAAASFFTEDGSGVDPKVKMQTYCEAILRAVATGKCVIIVNNLLPPRDRVVGVAHLQKLQLIADLNAMLIDLVGQSPFVSVVDIAGTVAEYGVSNAISLQNELVMRMPYTRHVLPRIIDEYARHINERIVARKKVVLLDADNTLWGGIVGEDGIHGIEIDGQFPGSVYRKFQAQLLELRQSGVLLALVTKNNEADVRDAFETLEMPLKWGSFAAIRANWSPKSDNIASIATELNVGLDSMVFIDDNPFELEQVGAAHPMVDCHKFDGRNAKDALSLLSGIPDLGVWALTDEDRAKSDQYAQEAQRKHMAITATSLDDYIQSLDIRIEAGINRVAHIRRIAQLTNKTNQFNLTTRRYSETEMLKAMEDGEVFDFRVTDKFGDMGIVGVSILRDGEVEAFLMSCRALGRNVETTMLEYCCAKTGYAGLRAHYIPTLKNEMAADFYEKSGLFDLFEQDVDKKTYVRAAGECIEVPEIVVEVS
jgi:FkbH-like protein